MLDDKVWITADGRHYFVREMSTDHIVACINHIKNNGLTSDEIYQQFLERFELELTIRKVGGKA